MTSLVDIAIVINAAVISSVDSHGGGATSYLTRSGAMSKQRTAATASAAADVSLPHHPLILHQSDNGRQRRECAVTDEQIAGAQEQLQLQQRRRRRRG